MKEHPTRLGRYRLLHRIGGGGMGEVHRARAYGAAGVTKEICIKRIRQERLAAPGALDAFVREARLSARLAHPNIVPVFDFGRSQDEYYLAMEWIDGVDLRALLDRGEALEDYVIAYIVGEIARALAYAHESAPDAPIVHRDVKPANVLLSRNGDVRLGDFGVATFVGSSGGVAGTPGYMAPEAKEGHAEVCSDLYSLGKLLSRMCVTEREPLAKIAAQLTAASDERPAAAEVAERLETYVAKIRGRGARSARALVAERVTDLADARGAPDDGGDALEHTESLLHPSAATASTAAPVLAVPSRPPRRHRTLAGALALAVIGSVGWLSADFGNPPTTGVATGDAKHARGVRAGTPGLAEAANLADDLAEDASTASSNTASSSTASSSTASSNTASSTPIPPGTVALARAPRRALARATRRAPVREAPSVRTVATLTVEAPPATGRVSINAIPWARVSIDGVDRGSTPLLGLELAAGASHRIVLVNDVLGARVERDVLLEAGESRRVIIDLRSPEGVQGQASASAQTTPPP